jgi:hypothetical protein
MSRTSIGAGAGGDLSDVNVRHLSLPWVHTVSVGVYDFVMLTSETLTFLVLAYRAADLLIISAGSNGFHPLRSTFLILEYLSQRYNQVTSKYTVVVVFRIAACALMIWAVVKVWRQGGP